jgi:HTH-type transcriptional regulator/antitoxin HigA
MKIEIRPIRNEKDYDWALKEIERYFEVEPKRDSPEGARFDVLAALIEAYEAKHWPIEPPDAVEAIRFRMQHSGWKQADLARLLGSRSRASEIMNRRRHLTLEQAHRLNVEWRIPADVLLRPYRLAPRQGVAESGPSRALPRKRPGPRPSRSA